MSDFCDVWHLKYVARVNRVTYCQKMTPGEETTLFARSDKYARNRWLNVDK